MYFDNFGEKEEMRDETHEDTTVSVHMEEIKCDILLTQETLHVCPLFPTSDKILFLHEQFIQRFERKNKLTDNPSEKKKTHWRGTHLFRDTLG